MMIYPSEIIDDINVDTVGDVWAKRGRRVGDLFRADVQVVTGQEDAIFLNTGESWIMRLWMHDYFNEIHPGQVDVIVHGSLHISQGDLDDSIKVNFKDTLKMTVHLDESYSREKKKELLYREILEQNEDEDEDGRINAFLSICDHTDVHLLINLLQVRNTSRSDDNIRKRIVFLLSQHDDWWLLVNYLFASATKYDDFFYSVCRRHDFFEAKHLDKLKRSKTLWGRLYLLRSYPSITNKDSMLGSLRAEATLIMKSIKYIERPDTASDELF